MVCSGDHYRKQLIQLRDEQDLSLLHHAVLSRDLDLIDLLIEQAKEIQLEHELFLYRDQRGITALELPIYLTDLLLLQALLEIKGIQWEKIILSETLHLALENEEDGFFLSLLDKLPAPVSKQLIKKSLPPNPSLERVLLEDQREEIIHFMLCDPHHSWGQDFSASELGSGYLLKGALAIKDWPLFKRVMMQAPKDEVQAILLEENSLGETLLEQTFQEKDADLIHEVIQVASKRSMEPVIDEAYYILAGA